MDASILGALRGIQRRKPFRLGAGVVRMKSPQASPSPDAAAFAHSIVRIAQCGDREAFACVFTHFAPRVKSYLLRLGATPEMAEELAQETLLTVWRRAAVFDPARAAASTWIFTIARNLRIDMARRDGRGPLTEDPSNSNPGPPMPDEALGATQSQTLVYAALAKLPKDQAQVVNLAFFSDKAHSEIAGELGLPLGTVKSRLRLAMARLRGSLGTLAP
jgi:RNA polymerase sigma-70 factor (ECF subfamily)